MTGLRERQKQDRRRRILASARAQLMTVGFERTLIETIAQDANVSTVTVHNYFGTKAGLLLAIVAEEESRFLALLRERADAPATSLADLAARFARDLFENIDAGLGRSTWRQIISSAIVETGSEASAAYHMLDQQIVGLLSEQVDRMHETGRIEAGHDSTLVADAMFRPIRDRMISFACNEDWSVDHAADLVAQDITVLTGIGAACAA